jgi:copper chaperone NosL
MKALFEKSNRILDLPLDLGPRALLVLAFILLIPSYLFPLWTLTMFAPQYPEGLRMGIYSWKLEGGHGGQDVKEINVLNHYIGMKDLEPRDFTEFKWIPFVVGAVGLLILRAAVLGKLAHAVDCLVLYLYFGAFSLWSFGYKLWWYGHHLAPTAAVKVAPFMPPMFGFKQLANFSVYSYPGLGSYALGLVVVALVAAIGFAMRGERSARPRLSKAA